MTEQDALAEARSAFAKADESMTAAMNVSSNAAEQRQLESADRWLRFAQTAALIAIAEALTEKKDVSS